MTTTGAVAHGLSGVHLDYHLPGPAQSKGKPVEHGGLQKQRLNQLQGDRVEFRSDHTASNIPPPPSCLGIKVGIKITFTWGKLPNSRNDLGSLRSISLCDFLLKLGS